MSLMPKRNLAPESEPWGRRVDERLDQIDKTVAQNKQDTNNAQSAVNSTVTKLSEQVAAIDELTQELATQQDLLEQQQAQLTEQVSQIAALVNSQVYPAPVHVDRIGFNVTAGANVTILSSSTTVPAGYSRALVYATLSVSAFNNGSTADNLYAGAVINGVPVGVTNRISAATGYIGAVSSTATSLVTSLGPSIEIRGTVSSDFATWTNPIGDNTASIDAMIIFLR